MSKELVQRLHNIWRDDDHERGCGGRSYDCTCGFDDRSFETAREAADLIERVQKIVDQSTGHPAEKLAKIARVLLPQPPNKGE